MEILYFFFSLIVNVFVNLSFHVSSDYMYKIDYVIVYNKTNSEKPNLKNYLENLKTNGLILTERIYKDDTVYVLIKTPNEKLFDMAEKLRLRLPIHVF